MFFFFFFFFKSCKDVRVLSQQMLGKMLGIGVVSPAVTLSGWILIDLKRLPEHQLRISFVCFFYFYLFKSLSENFCCYRSLHWHQRATEESSFGIELHYSAVSRKKLDKIPKWALTEATPLWEGEARVRKIRISLLRRTLLPPARPRVPCWIPSPRASLLCQNTLKLILR